MKEGGREMLTKNELRQFIGTEQLCCAQHKFSYVALPVMWRSSLGHESSRRKAKSERHIINRIIAFLDTPSGSRLYASALPVWSPLRKEPKLLLSSQDRFRHRCW